MTLDGAADSATNRFDLAENDLYLFEIQLVATRTDVHGHYKAWELVGCIERTGATTALFGAVTSTIIADTGEVWTIAVTANDANDHLAITVTGAAGETIYWVATARMTKVRAV